MYAYTIPPMRRTLAALAAILTKAETDCETRKIDPAALLTFRLYPDMLPFTRQVQLACDFAVRAATRLAGADVPGFPDTETTFAELQTRLAGAIAVLDAAPEAAFIGAETRAITIKMRSGDMTMTGQEYLTLYSLPQFHFHATTAYNILRHNGVQIGKRDYMGA